MYPTHCQGVLVLLEERVPAVFARMPEMGRQKKELQNWGYCCCISERFKKSLAYGKNNWCQQQWGFISQCATTHGRTIREREYSKSELEWPHDKIVLILGSNEAQFPIKKAMCILW